MTRRGPLGCYALSAALLAAACGARSPRAALPATSGTTAPRQTHAEIRDSSVDALPDYRVLVSPDITFAIVDVDAKEVIFRLRHRPGSFDAAITTFSIDLDIDQNSSTGSSGIEYIVMIFPEGGKGADVARTGAVDTVVGTVPVSFVADGCDVAVPLSMVGGDEGRFDFRVRVYAQPALPLVIDVLPDNGLVRME